MALAAARTQNQSDAKARSDAERRLAAALEEVVALRRSTSWRATAPLRRAMTALRRLLPRSTATAPSPAAPTASPAAACEVSLLIVSRDAVATLRCLQQIRDTTAGVAHEVLIADITGDHAGGEALRHAAGEAPDIRIFPLGSRHSGEAYNLLAEQARGTLLCLLSPDVGLPAGWLRRLRHILLTTPGAGAVGPALASAAGTIEATGYALAADGRLRPLRQEEPAGATPPEPLQVDHLPGAALLLARQLFLDAGGFDLSFEPGSYEDVDLSCRIGAMGAGLWCCADLVVTAPDQAARDDINRGKFVARWGHILRKPATAPHRRALVFSPYALTPGGGERYILTLAAALSRDHAVVFASPAPYSRLRLRTMGAQLGIDLSRVVPKALDALDGAPPFDLMIAMGNEMVPPIRARGRRNLFMCQFPFPLPPDARPAASDYEGYEAVLVNSDYTSRHLRQALHTAALPEPPIRIVSPPVPHMAGSARDKRPMILSVGRFFTTGHNKRHDLLIDAFRELHRRHDGAISLHLAGALAPEREHRDYLARLQTMAQDLPVEFHPDCTAETLRGLYRDAALYWHGTGLAVDLQAHPERAEHFGITIVEAMSAQCVTFALQAGGAPEIITEGEDGFLYKDAASLVGTSQRILAPDRREERIRIGEAASRRAEAFSEEAFCEQVRRLASLPVTDS